MDHTPIQVYMEQIVERLTREGPRALSELFNAPRNRSRLVGLFLALLELIRRGRLLVEQPDVFGDIRMALVPEAPAAPTVLEPPA